MDFRAFSLPHPEFKKRRKKSEKTNTPLYFSAPKNRRCLCKTKKVLFKMFNLSPTSLRIATKHLPGLITVLLYQSTGRRVCFSLCFCFYSISAWTETRSYCLWLEAICNVRCAIQVHTHLNWVESSDQGLESLQFEAVIKVLNCKRLAYLLPEVV